MLSSGGETRIDIAWSRFELVKTEFRQALLLFSMILGLWGTGRGTRQRRPKKCFRWCRELPIRTGWRNQRPTVRARGLGNKWSSHPSLWCLITSSVGQCIWHQPQFTLPAFSPWLLDSEKNRKRGNDATVRIAMWNFTIFCSFLRNVPKLEMGEIEFIHQMKIFWLKSNYVWIRNPASENTFQGSKPKYEKNMQWDVSLLAKISDNYSFNDGQ